MPVSMTKVPLPVEFQRGRWAASSLFAVNGFVMGAWAPQIPLLLPRYQISEAVLGLLILCLGLGAVGAMLFSGRLIAQHGSRRVLIGFAVLVIPALPLVVLSPSLWTLALSMAYMGAVIGSMDVAMNANMIEVERGLRRAILSASHGFWSLGAFVGGVAGSFVIEKAGYLVQALAVAGIVALVLGLAARHLHEEPVAVMEESAPKRHALLPRDAALWVLGFMTMAAMVPEGAVLDWAAIYLSKEHGSSLTVAGLGFALFAGAMAVIRFAGDIIRNRFGAVRTLRASGIVAAVGMMVAAFAPGPMIGIAGFTLAGLGIANMVPVLFSAAGNHPGLPSGIAVSTVTMLGYAGILVGPSVIGFVASHAGFRLTYATLALVLLGVGALAGRAAAADRSTTA